jgi:hypothetical protein
MLWRGCSAHAFFVALFLCAALFSVRFVAMYFRQSLARSQCSFVGWTKTIPAQELRCARNGKRWALRFRQCPQCFRAPRPAHRQVAVPQFPSRPPLLPPPNPLRLLRLRLSPRRRRPLLLPLLQPLAQPLALPQPQLHPQPQPRPLPLRLHLPLRLRPRPQLHRPRFRSRNPLVHSQSLAVLQQL